MIPSCPERRLLIQAHHDGELDVAAAAALTAHLEGCPGCAGLQADLASLSAALRAENPREAAPAALRLRIAASLPTSPARRARRAPRAAVAFGLGALLAASVMLLVPSASPTDALIAGHIRALQPGHLLDVVSTDQHTVKPWFDGRLDFAPPVKDLADRQFPLIGGRLDYIGGRPVAALVYRRDKHVIDLFVWPEPPRAAALPPPGGPSALQGYNLLGWSADGMVFRAVSDLAAPDLALFARDWQAAR